MAVEQSVASPQVSEEDLRMLVEKPAADVIAWMNNEEIQDPDEIKLREIIARSLAGYGDQISRETFTPTDKGSELGVYVAGLREILDL